MLGCLVPVGLLAGEPTTTNNGTVDQRTVTHVPGSTSANETVTLPDGCTITRKGSTQRTTTGRTTHAEATNTKGKTATYDSTRTKTENGYARAAETVRPNGATATKQVEVTKENGTVTRNATTTVTSRK